ncbi:MAG: multi-sensor hybrid histidine kinase, partial [Gemmatimonadetes bacterium]|nr:multi-sensor hybrid histidine kinase [Gemmatimonadota bacterium]
IAGARDLTVEFRTLWADGSVHWRHGRAEASYDAQGTPTRVLGIAMDMTERMLLEEQLRHAQKLEAIGQLAGGIAHDFNNVLTVILGFSELRLMEMSADDPGRTDILEIKKAGSRAAGLTRHLLAFSRKQILQPEVLDLNVLIDGIAPMMRLLIAEHVDLGMSLTAERAYIKVDRTQVEQILVNLAVNAADAMPRGGKLTVESRTVTLDKHYQHRHLPISPGDYVMLTVSDTGTGMTDEVSRQIFEPFFTTKDVGKGTGLGLATVYGIVKQSDGDISVSSVVDRGTTFTIYLPLAANAAPDVVQVDVDEPATGDRGTETILLVEDDEGVRLLARLTLERAGYHVLQAGDPRMARELAREYAGEINLLLSDVIMPESDGAPLVDELVKERPLLRVLYMSGYADEAIRHVLLIEGTPFLQKPFTGEVLARKVRSVLD